MVVSNSTLDPRAWSAQHSLLMLSCHEQERGESKKKAKHLCGSHASPEVNSGKRRICLATASETHSQTSGLHPRGQSSNLALIQITRCDRQFKVIRRHHGIIKHIFNVNNIDFQRKTSAHSINVLHQYR